MSKELFDQLRRAIKVDAAAVLAAKAAYYSTSHPAEENPYEVVANLILAYRHLEDASIRIGKAIQAHGGVSAYDKDTTVGA